MKLLKERLEKRGRLLRSLKIAPPLIDFASNDYLGFARSNDLKKNILEALQNLESIGSTGSRLLTGNSLLCEKVEEEIASFHQKESALLFSSGYTANLGLLNAIATRVDKIYYDEEIHASMRDGMILSRAKTYAWRHNDLGHLESLLQKNPGVVIVESLYSTDGSRAPLETFSLCQKYDSTLISDEAHAFGIFPAIPAHIHTYAYGKALGISGGAVVGPKIIKETLLNFSRPLIYSTAPNHLTLVAICEAHKFLQERKYLTENLLSLIEKRQLTSHIWKIECEDAKKEAAGIMRAGFHVNALLPPTVKKEALRVSLHAYNTTEEFDNLCLHLL